MIGRVVAEDRFLHQGIDHHLFVARIGTSGNEYRFEMHRLPPGDDHVEIIFEKLVDFTALLAQCPNTTIDQLVTAEMAVIRKAVFEEEEIHTHDA